MLYYLNYTRISPISILSIVCDIVPIHTSKSLNIFVIVDIAFIQSFIGFTFLESLSFRWVDVKIRHTNFH